MTTLNRGTGAEPLYAQVKRLVKSKITAGEYAPGDQLPTEKWLSGKLGVSRATVIKALDELSREGVVDRRQGSGTFVSGKRHPMVGVASFSGVTKEHGSQPSQRLLNVHEFLVGAPRDALTSHFPDSVDLTVLERLRLVNGQPVGVHRVAIPSRILREATLSRSDLESPSFSLYDAFARTGHSPAQATQTLRATACPEAVAAHLDIEPGVPVMAAQRCTHDAAGDLIEVVDATYVGSLYEYEVELSTQPYRPHDERHHHGNQEIDRHRGRLRVAVAERLRRDGARRR